MKKISVLLSMILLCGLGAFAQTRPDYSGEWTLDKTKTAATFEVESMTIKAAQGANEIRIEAATRFPDQANEISADGQTKRVRRPLGDGLNIYSLDGKETASEFETPAGKMPVKLQANFEADGKLILNATRTIETPNGEIAIVTKETWELADGGKTLKVTRETKAQNNANKVDLVLTKK